MANFPSNADAPMSSCVGNDDESSDGEDDLDRVVSTKQLSKKPLRSISPPLMMRNKSALTISSINPINSKQNKKTVVKLGAFNQKRKPS